MPFGRLTLVVGMAVRTSSKPMPYLLSVAGLSSTRTAGSELPPTLTDRGQRANDFRRVDFSIEQMLRHVEQLDRLGGRHD